MDQSDIYHNRRRSVGAPTWLVAPASMAVAFARRSVMGCSAVARSFGRLQRRTIFPSSARRPAIGRIERRGAPEMRARSEGVRLTLHRGTAPILSRC